MSTEAPPVAAPAERRIYLVLSILASVGLFVLVGWGISAFISHAVEQRMREQRPIYTLECRPKGEG